VHSKQAWRWAWGIWAFATAGSFAILETAALNRNYHPTLSTTLRRALGIYPRHWWGSGGLVALVAFWVWLTVHLLHVPDDVVFAPTAPEIGTWVEIGAGVWCQTPRNRKLV
jgi:hypothetical protein